MPSKNQQDLPTVDRLRHDIDRGRTGEKVDFPDPAAAPLGTDAEAAGRPPRRDEVALELSDRSQSRKRATMPGVAIYSVVAGAVAVCILAAVAIGAA